VGCPPLLMTEHHFIEVNFGDRLYQSPAQEALQIQIPLPMTDTMQMVNLQSIIVEACPGEIRVIEAVPAS
jgi:hypothetical protein